MPDIFDQAATEAEPQGDVFDQAVAEVDVFDQAAAEIPKESQSLGDIGRQFISSVAKSTIDPLVMASRIGSKLPGGKLSDTVSGVTGAPSSEEIISEMEGASARTGEEYGVNPKHQDTFASMAARGFGQAVPTLAAGRAAPIVSALMAGEQGFQEARSFGATGAKLIAATGVNATTALITEKLMGVPKILGLIKNAKPVASSVLKTALKTAGFEGGQEVLEQIMQDWTAQKLYDPKRKIFDWGKLATVFGVGAFVGSGVGGVLQTASNLSTPISTEVTDPKAIAPKSQVQEVATAVDESLARLATEQPPVTEVPPTVTETPQGTPIISPEEMRAVPEGTQEELQSAVPEPTGETEFLGAAIRTPEGIVTGESNQAAHLEIMMDAATQGRDIGAKKEDQGFAFRKPDGTIEFVDRESAAKRLSEAGMIEGLESGTRLLSEHVRGLVSGVTFKPKQNVQETKAPTEEEVATELLKHKKQAVQAAKDAGALEPDLIADQAIDEMRAKGSTDPALLTTIARRRAIDQGRKVTPTVAAEEAPEASVERGPRAEAVSEEDIQSIEGKVASLPEVQRNIIRELENDPDLTDQEVGSILNLTIDQVKKAKAAFRKTMREFIQSQGIRARLGPGAANVEEALAQYEVRKFGKRFQETEEIAPEIKAATGDRFYEPIPNQVTAEKATEIIEKNGEENAEEQIRDEKSSLSFADRATVGQILIKKLNARFQSMKDKTSEEARALLDRASNLAEWAADFGTRLGQGVQSFAMWMRLTAEGKLRTYQKAVKARQDDYTRNNRGDIDEIKDTLNGATKESSVKASGSTKVRAKLASSKRKSKSEGGKKEKEKPRPKSLDRDVWVQYQQQAIKNIETALFSGKPQEQPALQEFTNRLVAALKGKIPAKIKESPSAAEKKAEDIRVIREAMTNREKYEEVWTNTTNALKLRYGNRPDILKKIDEVFAGGLKNPLNPKTLQSLIRERIKSDEIKLSDLVQQHYSKAEETGKSLADKISEEIGLDEAGSREVANAIESEFAAGVTKTKARALASLVKTNPTAKKLSKSDAQKLIEVSNLGALTDKTFYDAVSESLGLPEYTPAVAAEIMRLATKVDQAPEGMPKQEAMLELNKYLAQQKGYNPSDLLWGYYYGNILSGTGTHLVNAFDTALNVLNEGVTLAFQNPRSAARIFAGLARGAARGKADAWLALTKGRRISDGKFVEDPFLMEISEFGKKGGVPIKADTALRRTIKAAAESKIAYPLNAWKYVGRAMSASDALMFRAAQEMKAAVLADQMANGDVTGDQILGYDQLPEFRAQAESEGYKGQQAEARATELMLMSRPEAIQKASTDFAAEGTYNIKPYGLIGTVSNSVESLSRKVPPLKLIVPFTRIVGNVLNRNLNNTPFGYYRAIRGKAGSSLDPKTLKKYNAEERNALLIRATVSSALLSAAATMHALGYIQINGGGPADPEKKKQLRQTGWKPYTVKVGNHYWNYSSTPIALGLAILGNFLDNTKYNDFSSKDMMDKVAYALQAVSGSLLNQSFLTNLGTFWDALASKNPGEQFNALKRLSASSASAMGVPMNSLMKDVEQWFSDPNVPKADTLKEAIISQVPFASQELKPQLNAFGKPIKSDRSRFETPVTTDPAWRIVMAKDLRVPVPNNFFDDRNTQYDYVREQGNDLEKWVLKNEGRLRNMDNKQAQHALESASDSIRQRIRNKYLRSGGKKKQKP